MEIIISSVTNEEEEFMMLKIRQRVFKRELGIEVDCLTGEAQKNARHLIARISTCREVVAALSVVETSGNCQLHARYESNLPSEARVARYTQLAVTRPYRGLGIPLMLILEANRRFVVTEQFDYTWLLYNAERAIASPFCQLLAFVPSERIFQSEYGYSRVLLRDESTEYSALAISQAEQYLQRLLKFYSLSVRSESDTLEQAQQPPRLPAFSNAQSV